MSATNPLDQAAGQLRAAATAIATGDLPSAQALALALQDEAAAATWPEPRATIVEAQGAVNSAIGAAQAGSSDAVVQREALADLAIRIGARAQSSNTSAPAALNAQDQASVNTIEAAVSTQSNQDAIAGKAANAWDNFIGAITTNPLAAAIASWSSTIKLVTGTIVLAAIVTGGAVLYKTIRK